MNTPRETWQLPHQHIGGRVLCFDSLASTNDLAAAHATEPTNHGLVILADEQRQGRGQYGRSWQAPAGSSVLMSVLLFPPNELRQPVLLTAWAAVCVSETILQLTGIQAKIKWPNDVLLHGRKVCGILIEQGHGTVVGIGLNLNQSAEDFERAGLPLAGSLAIESGRRFDHSAVAKMLVERLDAEYDLLLSGAQSMLESLWKWRLGLLGRNVIAEGFDGAKQRGRLVELTFARVEIEQAGGTCRHFVPGNIRQLTEEPA